MPGQDVFVVDDDPAILQALSLVFRRAGWGVRSFNEAATALDAIGAHPPACLLLDVLMPIRDGLDMLSELQRRCFGRPVIMMSGAGDIPMAVEAMRRGAADFVPKPFHSDVIVARAEQAVSDWAAKRMQPRHLRDDFPGHAMLTRRERDVLNGIAAGATAKQAALTLAISPRTVEFHRARIFEKLGAKNSADLMRIVMGAVN